jgi:HAD superfamily hydrolase (TIGR01509 family)
MVCLRGWELALVSGPELIIFDCDGVLVDSEEITDRILAAALTDLGLPISPIEARRRFLGPPLAQVVSDIESQLGRDLGLDWVGEFEARRAEAFREELQPMPGAADVLAQIAKAGVAFCTASQATLGSTRLKLEVTGLAQFFSDATLFSAEQVSRGKPWPDLFLHAAETIGVEPQRCAVVEDSPRGVAAAIAAGMRAFGLCSGGDVSDLLTAGAEPLASLRDLPALVGVPCQRASTPEGSASSGAE